MKISEKNNTEKDIPLREYQLNKQDQKYQQVNTTNVENTPDGLKRAIDNPNRLEPTRYGDWEKKGRCIDF